jgi:hypothetical protein
MKKKCWKSELWDVNFLIPCHFFYILRANIKFILQRLFLIAMESKSLEFWLKPFWRNPIINFESIWSLGIALNSHAYKTDCGDQHGPECAPRSTVEISSGVDFGLCALSDNSVSAAAISRTARKIYLISTAAARHQHTSSEKLSHMLLGPRGGCICLLVLSRCAALAMRGSKSSRRAAACDD